MEDNPKESEEPKPIIYNKYKKLVLNTSSELKFTKIKSTFLCSEAKKEVKKIFQNIIS